MKPTASPRGEPARVASRGRGAPELARTIGAQHGEQAGPLLLCIAGLHGNEPSGTVALERVLGRLARDNIPMRGDLVGLRGNLRALAAGTRFIDEDMNRVWQRDRVAAILASLAPDPTTRQESDDDHGRRAPRKHNDDRQQNGGHRHDSDHGRGRPGDGKAGQPMVGSAELAEQRDLLAAVRRESRRARGPIYVLDLHTTSSDSAPFTTLGDTLQNRDLALRLPVPAVLGLEEQIDGAMLQYFDRLGWRSIGIEGGQHEAASSAEAHEDAVWVLLDSLGLIERGGVPGIRERRARLVRRAEGLPRVLDVRYRHVVREEDGFQALPGFRNFDPVRDRQEVGGDRNGPVHANMAGRIFLPLYQRQGDDGFFIVRPLAPVWLSVSRTLRLAGASRLAPWLPGVHPHPEREDAVVVARWARNRLTIGLLHLLGFTARSGGIGGVMIRRVEAPGPNPGSE